MEGAIKEAKSVEGLDLESAIKKATELSSLCHKSSLSEQRIKKEIQNMLDENDTVDKEELKYVKIISPVKTRWNSTLMMIESIVRMRRPLSSIRDNPGSDPNKFAPAIPSEDEFDLFDEILPILRKISDISESFSADKKVSIHRVISHLYGLKYRLLQAIRGGLSPTAEMFYQKLVKAIDFRFPESGATNLHYSVANLLNPLYKGQALKKIGGFDEAYDSLITKSQNHQEWTQASQEMEARQLEGARSQGSQPDDDPFFDLASDVLVKVTSAPADQSSITIEWEMHLKVPAVTGLNVLDFWRTNKHKFPLLAESARKWLCVPASSASSERAFSAGGAIVSYKRTKLQPEQVEKLLYIQQNYVKVKIKKWLLTSDEEQAEEAAAVEGPASPSPAASRASTPNVVDLTVEDNY